MTRRELPARINRGKNSYYETQVKTLKSQRARTALGKGRKTNWSLQLQKKHKNQTQNRRELYNENKINFKFTRGIHYFHDLNKLQRAEQSVSYAIFCSKKQRKITKTNNYAITYSKDEELIGKAPISELINRNYIGLPKHKQNQQQSLSPYLYNQKTVNEVLQMKRNDKNQCHHYLFQSQDKKHNLDRIIKQFQFIRNKIDFFLKPENISKLKKFSAIQKDNQLSQVFFENDELTHQQKIHFLSQKIGTLYDKRQKLNHAYEHVSSIYFQDSLDQKLFNQIKKQKNSLNRFEIYHVIQKSIKQHQKQTHLSENSVILNNFHNEKQYSKNSQIEDYFCIDQKTFDPFIMQKALKIISTRLFHQGQSCFYFGKKMFIRLLDKQMKLQKQIRPVSFEQYTQKMKEIQQSLRKHWRKKVFTTNIRSKQKANTKQLTRKDRQQISKKAKSQISKKQICLKTNEKAIPIQFYEYYCLKIFETIHDALLIIKDFMHKNQKKKMNLVQHLASLYYPKLQNKLLTIVQTSKFGVLSQALDKLVDVITHKSKQFQSMNYQLFLQYSQKNKKITTFVRQVQSYSDSEQSSHFKRPNSTSQLLNQNQQDQVDQLQVFRKGRKMVK